MIPVWHDDLSVALLRLGYATIYVSAAMVRSYGRLLLQLNAAIDTAANYYFEQEEEDDDSSL